jgi:pimeloyl-ACP methyl ester carboxylesterase
MEIVDMQRIFGWRMLRLLIVAWLCTQIAGCASLHRARWQTATLTSPDPYMQRKECSIRLGSFSLANAEIAYAAATQAMEQGDASCVDEFFRAAKYAWDDVEQTTSERYSFSSRASEIYRSSLNAIVTEGQKHCRLDPRIGLRIQSTSGWSTIPITHHGFPRGSEEFDALAVVGEYSIPQLNQTYRRNGVGIPVIAIRNHESNEPFQRKRQGFAATLVLRQAVDSDSTHDSSTILELHDPLRILSIAHGQSSLPLASDSTAPIARALSTIKRSYVQSFLQPGLVRPDDEGLFMLEPYQQGKIPIIFVHGLLSDRLTWANIVNELHARPEFLERYQLWGFEYPTGEPFLTSATLLRSQLNEIRARFDPQETDEALNHVVLIGHSMGGLISKMQITESGTALWNSLSNRHFEQVAMSHNTRKRFSEAVFFVPSPMVSRVIFIGTPHRGSALAQRAIGRVGSLLIKETADLKDEHDRLIKDNPGVFSEEFSRRIPTSIDMLEPKSDLLQAIHRLPINSRVRVHSIVGEGRWMPGNGDSDGVVPVSSAKHEQSLSVTMVAQKHAKLTEDPAVIQQVLRILREHCSVNMTVLN